MIDPKSGNVLGGFAREEDALASLRRSLQTHGPQAIHDLSLMQITDHDQIVVSMQEDLERLVRDSEFGVARLLP